VGLKLKRSLTVKPEITFISFSSFEIFISKAYNNTTNYVSMLLEQILIFFLK